MKIPSPLPFIRAHLLLFGLILLGIALGTGGYYGWRHYQFMQTSEYAFQNLQKALVPPVPEKIAQFVNFQTISSQLARAVARTFPFYHQGPGQLNILREKIQSAILQGFRDKQDLLKAPEQDEKYMQSMLKKDLVLLQPDFMPQLISNLRMKEKTHASPDAPVLLVSSVRHDQLNREFPFVLSMVKDEDGWKVRDLVNAESLVLELRKALIARLSMRHNLITQLNRDVLSRMNNTLPVQSCTVNAGLLSDQSTLLVVIHVLARNVTNLSIHNMALGVDILNAKGSVLLHRFLNAAVTIAPGEDLNRRWTIELDGKSPLGQSILQSGGLKARAQWQSMTLSSSEVLHLYEVPKIMEKCPREKHMHPAGLCTSPIFAD